MLAALEWNIRHASREAVLDPQGRVVQDVVYSKRRKIWVLRVRYVKRQSLHVHPLMQRVLKVHYNKILLPPVEVPDEIPKHVPVEEKPSREDLLAKFTTRFSVAD